MFFKSHVLCDCKVGLFSWAELVLSNSAKRAFKIFWQVFERSTWLNAHFWHSHFRVVFPSTCVANVFSHNCCLCLKKLIILFPVAKIGKNSTMSKPKPKYFLFFYRHSVPDAVYGQLLSFFSWSRLRISTLLIFPLLVFGSSSTNSITRGYL